MSGELSDEQRSQIHAILKPIKHLFITDPADLRPANLPPVTIPTGDASPIALSPICLSPKQLEAMYTAVEKMEKAGVIEKRRSPWSFRPLLVEKKGQQEPRVVVDFRKLNEVIIGDKWPLPRAEDMFQLMRNMQWFALADLKGAFHQLLTCEADRDKLSFTVPGGAQYSYTCLPMGLKLSSMRFQAAMYWCLSTMRGKAIVFQDDIAIFGRTFEDFLKNLKEFTEVAKLCNLQFSLKKCRFGFRRIRYLGFVISAKGKEIDPEHTRAIVEYPPPTNIQETRRYCGMLQYYAAHIEHMNHALEPILKLLRKGERFVWGSEQQESFYLVKLRLLS